jgi:hypothetical protein
MAEKTTMALMQKGSSIKIFRELLNTDYQSRMKCPFNCRINKIVILIFILNGLFGHVTYCQSRESLVKAGYIEKFTHFVQWPETSGKNDNANEFILAVIGRNTFGKDLEELFSKIKIKDYPVRIKYITKIEEIKDCMILFISGSEKNDLEKILKYTTGKSILTISDSKGFGKSGVIINMFSEGNYIKYEVNRNTLEKSGLKINSLLLNYAVII